MNECLASNKEFLTLKLFPQKDPRKKLALRPLPISVVGLMLFLVLSFVALSISAPAQAYATASDQTTNVSYACGTGYGLTPEGCAPSTCFATGVNSVGISASECSGGSSDSPLFPTNSWVEYATSSVLTKELSGNWIVPKAPTSDDGQTIFLWIGSQQGTWQNHYGFNVIQPVLQWGESADGGGNFWAVASWYVNPDTGEAFASPLLRVNVGDKILGNMTSSNCSSKGCDWVIVSLDQTTGKSTTLNLKHLLGLDPPQHHVYVTLEVYSVDSCSDYPASSPTGFFNLRVNLGHTIPSWKPKILQNDGCGEKVSVINSTSVSLYY